MAGSGERCSPTLCSPALTPAGLGGSVQWPRKGIYSVMTINTNV